MKQVWPGLVGYRSAGQQLVMHHCRISAQHCAPAHMEQHQRKFARVGMTWRNCVPRRGITEGIKPAAPRANR